MFDIQRRDNLTTQRPYVYSFYAESGQVESLKSDVGEMRSGHRRCRDALGEGHCSDKQRKYLMVGHIHECHFIT
jgi:hypothetical protein